jgi:opacity protein-like surface antigen
MKTTRNALALIATGLLGTFAGPALAQDSNAGPFDGFYVGGEIGAVRSDAKARVTPVTGGALNGKSDRTNANFGVFVGYGSTLGERFYLGTELELGSGAGKSKTVALGGVNTRERSNYEAALTTRLGFMVADSTMLYATTGAVLRQSRFAIANNAVRKETITGSRFGLGVMQECTDNIFIRGELDRTEFNKKSFAAAALPTTRYKPEATTLRIGIGYRF